MDKISTTFSEFPYTANPYGYARRLTEVVEIGKIPIGGKKELCVQGKVTDGLNGINSIVIENKDQSSGSDEVQKGEHRGAARA
jgi:hypothetical protein